MAAMKKTTIDVERHRPLRWLLPDIIINNTDVSSSRDDTATRAATVCYTTKTGTYTARETLDARDPQHCSSAAADGLFLLAEIATRRRRSFRLFELLPCGTHMRNTCGWCASGTNKNEMPNVSLPALLCASANLLSVCRNRPRCMGRRYEIYSRPNAGWW